MDGQRRVWLDQTARLDNGRFFFTWIAEAFEPNPQNGNVSVLFKLLDELRAKNRNVQYISSPGYALSKLDLVEKPADGSQAVSEIWRDNVTAVYEYVHNRFVAANYNIDLISPLWCRNFYTKVRQVMLDMFCNVTVYANDRYFSSNVLILDTSRILGIPSVGELSNQYMHLLTVPDIIVAPSLFSAQQKSIRAAIHFDKQKSTPRVVIISPSVDTDTFNPSLRRSERKYQHPSCEKNGLEKVSEATENRKRCFIVGFVSRLSPGT